MGNVNIIKISSILYTNTIDNYYFIYLIKEFHFVRNIYIIFENAMVYGLIFKSNVIIFISTKQINMYIQALTQVFVYVNSFYRMYQ